MLEKLKPLINEIGEEYFSFEEKMKLHTTFKIGGPVSCMIFPKRKEDIIKIIKYLVQHNIRYLTIGNGSNLLVDDEGFNGVVVKLSNNFSHCKIEDNRVYVESGISMHDLAYILASHQLKGFEPLSGIPGTIGGALSMNAGAYEEEIKSFVESVEAIDQYGNVYHFSNEEMNFGYRKSVVIEKKLVILSAILKFEFGNEKEILSNIEDYTLRRKSRQPLEYGSAGSMFKRPIGHFAGKLIDDCGLRGYRVNDAQVSSKHAGFVINIKDATFKDVMQLVEDVKLKVKDTFGIELEQEVKVIYRDEKPSK